MTTTRNRIGVGVMALVLGLLIWSAPASATTYTLSHWNINELNTAGALVTVTTGTSGGNTTLSIELTFTDGIPLTPIGISEFAYNAQYSTAPVVRATTGITGNTQSWSFAVATAPCTFSSGPSSCFSIQADGFGKFTNDNMTMGQETGGVSTALGGSGPLVFTLPDTPTFINNDGTGGQTHNATFAVFVKWAKLEQGSPINCSGWVSDGITTSLKSDANCAGAPVPEPGTLALLGSGLVSLGVVVRRRLFSREGAEQEAA